MSNKVPKRISSLAVKSRRQEIERRLAAYGLTSGPRRLFRGAHTAEFEQARSRRLRLALENLGPIFSSFGLYMSTRADLWPIGDCLELAAIPDSAAAMSTNSVRELLTEEVDCRIAGAQNQNGLSGEATAQKSPARKFREPT